MTKIHIHCGNNIRVEFENYDILIQAEGIIQTESYFFPEKENESIEEILVSTGCLKLFSREEISQLLERWWVLLKPEGLINIYFEDIYPLMNNFISERFSIQQLEQNILNSKSLLTMHEVAQMVEESGLNILLQNYEDQIGIIHAKK